MFNYFLPYYKFPGVLSNTGLDSPEFQLSTDTNVMNLTNNLTIPYPPDPPEQT